MKGYVDIIKSALDEVPQEYYKLYTTYSTEGIVRERIFCYELYHRIRCIQERQGNMSLIIHGEIDKRGHELFEREDQLNPDFIFHIPGSMESNKVVVEVKGRIENSNYRQGVVGDFKTIIKFVDNYNYEIGIFIAYNYSLEDFKSKLSGILQKEFFGLNPKVKNRIVILCKTDASSLINECTLNELLESGV